jgi:hypothetical protein
MNIELFLYQFPHNIHADRRALSPGETGNMIRSAYTFRLTALVSLEWAKRERF